VKRNKCGEINIKSCRSTLKHERKKCLTMKQIVSTYKKIYLPAAHAEWRWFASAKNIKEAIARAVSSELNEDGNYMSSHQRRIGRAKLAKAAIYFGRMAEEYASATNFEQVYAITKSVSTPKELRIGELAKYDFSTRVSAFLNLKPESVYLHAGTRTGARNLGYLHENEIIIAQYRRALTLHKSAVRDCTALNAACLPFALVAHSSRPHLACALPAHSHDKP